MNDTNAYARGEHFQLLLGYLENIERLATHAQSLEDWELASVDLLDNCAAAKKLLKGMIP